MFEPRLPRPKVSVTISPLAFQTFAGHQAADMERPRKDLRSVSQYHCGESDQISPARRPIAPCIKNT